MRNQKITLCAALICTLLPFACSGQSSPPVTSSKGHAESQSTAHSVKSNKEKIAPAKSGSLAHLGTVDPEVARIVGDSFNYSRAGDQSAGLGNWAEAKADYETALSLVPTNQPALYGMARYAERAGDIPTAIKYYRLDIYSQDPARYGIVPGDGYQNNDVTTLMRYAILLSRAGIDQEPEAIKIYDHAAHMLDYDQGQLKVTLPELVSERTLPDQVRYTPERLQALADTAIAHEEMSFGSAKEALGHMREAVKLYPDSPVTNYYLGEALPSTATAEEKAAYQKAVDLGDDATITAAKERLSTLP